MDYLPQLLAIQKQVNALIAEMQKGAVTPSKSIETSDAPDAPKKKRGRPSKKDMEAAKIAAAEAADAISEAGPPTEGPKKRGPQTPEAKAAAVAKRKATMERKKAEKAAEEEALKRASEADTEAQTEDETPKSSASSVASVKPKIKILAKKIPVAPPAPEPLVTENSDEESKEERNNRTVYRYMFRLQESGICNMMASGDYLKRSFGLSAIEAEDYVLNYISNYEALRTKYCEELS